MRSRSQLSHFAVVPRRPCRAGVISMVVVLVMAAAAVADTLDSPSHPVAAADTTAVAVPGLAPTAFGTEVAAALAAEEARLAALQIRFETAPDEDGALAIQREIVQIKVMTEIAILRIQERHARAAGRADEADRILMAVLQLTTPAPVVQPAPRPAPTPGEETGAR